jgi:hypothetical protein
MIQEQVFFVGMHNKPNLQPLDSSTKSGKLIDVIIRCLSGVIECQKTNLIDLDYLPDNMDVIAAHNGNWHQRSDLNEKSIVILLGKWVQSNFHKNGNYTIINVPHPASVYGTENRQKYIENICVEVVTAKGVNRFKQLRKDTELQLTSTTKK